MELNAWATICLNGLSAADWPGLSSNFLHATRKECKSTAGSGTRAKYSPSVKIQDVVLSGPPHDTPIALYPAGSGTAQGA